MFNKLIRLGRAFANQINIKHVGAYASSAAFFMFLSLIPILLLLCSVIPYTPITEANLMGVLTDMLPTSLAGVAVSIVAEVYDRSTAIVSVTIIATIWSAAKGILALIRGLNVINDVKETRNYIILRIRACIYTVILLLAIIVTLMILVFGKMFAKALIANFPNLRYLLEFLLSIRFVVTLFVLCFFFTMLYSFLPNERVRFKTQIPGSFFVSVVWSVFSWGFSFFINRYSAFSMYGSLSTIIMIMLWLYICMYIILFGALVNRFFLPANKYLWRKRVLSKKEEKNAI